MLSALLKRSCQRPLCLLPPALFCLTLFCCLLLPTAQAVPLTLTLAYADIESFPYQAGNGIEPANPPGIAVELIQQAAADLGIKVNFLRMPVRRVLSEMEEGHVDGGFIYSYNSDRIRNGVYPLLDGKPDRSRRLATLHYVLYRRMHDKVSWDGNQFSHLSTPLGANTGYSVVADLRRQGVNVEEARSTAQNIQKLRSGRLDAYVAQAIVVDAYLAGAKITDIEKIAPPVSSKDYFLMFSHQFYASNSQLAEALWKHLGEIRDRATEQLAKRYQD